MLQMTNVKKNIRCSYTSCKRRSKIWCSFLIHSTFLISFENTFTCTPLQNINVNRGFISQFTSSSSSTSFFPTIVYWLQAFCTHFHFNSLFMLLVSVVWRTQETAGPKRQIKSSNESEWVKCSNEKGKSIRWCRK